MKHEAPEPPEEANPYAPPQASLATPPRERIEDRTPIVPCWRQGEVVFIPPGGHLPPRCLRCNEPACLPPSYWQLSAFANHHDVIVYGLCRRHTFRRRLTLGLTALVFLAAAFIRFQPGPSSPSRWPVEVPMLVGCLISGILHSRLIRPVSTEGGIVAFKGGGAPFLDSLPEGPDHLPPEAN